MKNPVRAICLLTIFFLAPVTAEEGTRFEHREEPVPPPRFPVLRALQPRSAGAVVARGNHRSVQVNVDQGANIVGDAANEPSLAIDPTNPNRIVIGWRQFDSVGSDFRQAGYAYSANGGASWTFPGSLDPGVFRSDPVLSSDSAGNFYYYCLSSPTNADFFISNNGGTQWAGPISAFGGDKIWQTVDIGGAANNHLYAIWNSDATCCSSGTDLTRSTDGGNSYDGPFDMPQNPKWGTLDVGPNGELYVAGVSSGGGSHRVLRSDDALNELVNPTFNLATAVNLGGPTVGGGSPNPQGLLGQVWVAVDRSAGSTRGNVYVLSSVNPSGSDPLDVHLVRSTDDGQSWSTPTPVNDNPGDGSYQWFGTMSVSPEGRIDVVWNDTRNGPSTISELYYAYSTDTGISFSEGLPVSPAFDSTVGFPNQAKLGDYYHMISETDNAALAYAATFNGEQDIYFLRVGDCNDNGSHDSVDVAGSTSQDTDANGIPDECETDCNGNSEPDAADISNGTSDDCNENFVPDECEQDVDCGGCTLSPPAEPQGLQFDDLNGGLAWLSWSPVPDAASYNVYRGSLHDLSDLACYKIGLPTLLVDDGLVPPAGGVLFYTATAVNCAGESSLGPGRQPSVRCP